MHYAVRQSSEALVRTLLDHGADPNAQTPSGLATPLHRAAARDRVAIVKLLLGERLSCPQIRTWLEMFVDDL